MLTQLDVSVITLCGPYKERPLYSKNYKYTNNVAEILTEGQRRYSCIWVKNSDFRLIKVMGEYKTL